MSNPQVQESTQTETKAKKSRGVWLLILLIIFLILFLLSSIVLGSRLFELANRDKYAVDMTVGTAGELELFKIEYANESGEITVQGANGQDVIAPGTGVNYDINLRNRDDVGLSFVMLPQVTFLTEDPVPLQVKLTDHYGNYLLGSDSQWVSVDALNGLTHKGEIREGEIFTYHLSWQWVFETGEDGDNYDTYLGNDKDMPGVEISLQTESTAKPALEKSNAHKLHLLGEGFGCCWCCWLVWLLLLLMLVLLIFHWRLRRKYNRQVDTVEEYEEVLQRHGLLIDGKLVKK